MSKAFNDLEKQLRSAVRARGAPRKTWARRGRRQTWVIVAAALLLISAGAFGASRIAQGTSAQTQGRELAFQAARDTEHLASCRRLEPTFPHVVFTDAPALPAITRLLPLLAVAPTARERARASTIMLLQGPNDGAVLSQTVHLITLQEGIHILAFVDEGGWGAVRDPAACERARQARVLELTASHTGAIRAWAQLNLRHMPDTTPGTQSLVVFAQDPRQPGAGASIEPIVPGQPLEPGLRLVSGQRGGSRLFIGIAGAHATAVRIQTKRPRTLRGVRIQVPVRGRFYAVKIPRGTGPFRLLEIAASGTTLHSIDLRQ